MSHPDPGRRTAAAAPAPQQIAGKGHGRRRAFPGLGRAVASGLLVAGVAVAAVSPASAATLEEVFDELEAAGEPEELTCRQLFSLSEGARQIAAAVAASFHAGARPDLVFIDADLAKAMDTVMSECQASPDTLLGDVATP